MQLGLEHMTVIGNELALRWTDGTESYFPLEFLRRRCPCALVRRRKRYAGQRVKGNRETWSGQASN